MINPAFREVQDIVKEVIQRGNVDSTFGRFATIEVGSGVRALHVDKDGIWLGGVRFPNAMFSVDMDGRVTLRSIAAINGYDTSDNVDAKIELSRLAIESVVANTYATQATVTTLTQQADNLTVKIERSGGTNLLKNSSGLKGTTINEWGTAVTVDRSPDTQASTEAHSAMYLSNQSISQTVDTIVGQVYTVRLRFRKTAALYLTLTGVTDPVEVTTDGYVSDVWATFSYQFTATSSSTTLTIYNSTSYAYIADIVLKLGEAFGWQPAPNETYGQSYRFDQNGLRVSDTNNTFISQLDENGLTVADIARGDLGSGNEVIAMEVTRERGKINNLVAQTSLTVQRYENTASAFRIIATATGCMFVIND